MISEYDYENVQHVHQTFFSEICIGHDNISGYFCFNLKLLGNYMYNNMCNTICLIMISYDHLDH